jgi:hypothetical protein
MRSLRGFAIVLAVLLTLYVGSYLMRSARGRYEPAAIGLSGIKWYEWAPQGFVRANFQYDFRYHRIYYPLWRLDRRLWHRPIETADETGYPVHEVSDSEVVILYRAWDAVQRE